MTYLFMNISKNMKGLLNKELSNYGVTAAQFSVMNQLDKIGDTAKASTIADLLGSDRPTVSSIIQRLYLNKLVIRKDDPKDRRSKFVLLTKEGKEKLYELTAIADDVNNQFFEHLAVEEQKIINNYLQELNRKLEVMNE